LLALVCHDDAKHSSFSTDFIGVSKEEKRPKQAPVKRGPVLLPRGGAPQPFAAAVRTTMPQTVDAKYLLEQTELRPEMNALCAIPLETPVASWNWTIARIPVPALDGEEVLVKVYAAALSKQDFSLMHYYFNISCHRFSVPENKMLHVPGVEVSGTILAVGENVVNFAPGDDVIAVCAAGGGCAEFVAVSYRAVTKKPPAMRHDQAAALPYSGLVGIQAFGHASAILSEPNAKILVNGSTTGEGAIVIQLTSAQNGPLVIARMDDPVGQNVLRALGADDAADDATLESKYPLGSFDALFDCLGDAEKVRKTSAISPGWSFRFGNIICYWTQRIISDIVHGLTFVILSSIVVGICSQGWHHRIHIGSTHRSVRSKG
jgi:D-arabinose 1-dehydrogenase-like Zn-dependent alcohol dehydrogenase